MVKRDRPTNQCEFEDLKKYKKDIVYKILYSFIDEKGPDEQEKEIKPLEPNEIFLSEADLQFSFAQRAKDMGAEDIILEYPIMATTLYSKILKNINPKPKKTCREYLDLRFEYGEYGEYGEYVEYEYFIEFKYKLSDINEQVSRHQIPNEFKIKNQGAENNCRYYIYEDIQRMENIKKIRGEKCKAFVIFITNDSAYWRLNGYERKKEGAAYSNFPLCIKENTATTNSGKLSYKVKRKGIEHIYRLAIENPYPLQWFNFKTIGNNNIVNNDFRLLIIDLQKEENNTNK